MAKKTLHQIEWEADNQIYIGVKVNRNQDPELFAMLEESPSKSKVLRDLMQEGLDIQNQRLWKALEDAARID